MPTQPKLSSNRKNFSIYILAAIALSIFPTWGAEAQTTWTITVVATGNHQKPVRYDVSRVDTGVPCVYSNNDAKKLKVCLKDTIRWAAETDAGTDGTKKNELFVFHEDPILIDTTNATVQTLHASYGKTADGHVDPHAPQGDHEYYVAIYDKSNTRWYAEDPKIIIGGTLAIDLVLDIQKDCKQLSPLLEKADDLTKLQKDKITEGCKVFSDIHTSKY
jgi:hypothetical protein